MKKADTTLEEAFMKLINDSTENKVSEETNIQGSEEQVIEENKTEDKSEEENDKIENKKEEE